MKKNKSETNCEQTTITLPPHLDFDSCSDLWNNYKALSKSRKKDTITVDASQLIQCDSTGLGLLSSLLSPKNKIKAVITDLDPEIERYINDMRNGISPIKSPNKSLKIDHIPAKVGELTSKALATTASAISFAGEVLFCLGQCLKRPKQIRWKDVLHSLEAAGPSALPLTALLGFLLGLILTFQSAVPLEKYGAILYVINLVAISLVREIGPLMVGIILAARSASSFAAEIGTMKFNQEIDALTTMGLGAVRFLVIPRLVATALMSPVLYLYILCFGFVGCYVVALTFGFTTTVFFNQLFSAFTLTDVMLSLFKCLTFGILVAITSCMHGLRTEQHALAIGQSTTKAVVSSVIIIGCADGIFAVIFYALGV